MPQPLGTLEHDIHFLFLPLLLFPVMLAKTTQKSEPAQVGASIDTVIREEGSAGKTLDLPRKATPGKGGAGKPHQSSKKVTQQPD